MTRRCLPLLLVLFACLAARPALADVGDPQVRTDHPWYPGELACSTYERLFATQAELYERVVGVKPTTDEQKALAAWLWRNAHYWHGEEGVEDLWGRGFTKGFDTRTREYWTGLFAHGFGLCGTTHSQWTAEMEVLLGHNRGRAVGLDTHNSFEVFLTGGPYGDGRWALLDHDQSTVVFDRDGKRLLSAREVRDDWKRLTDRTFAPEKQHGWLVCGLHPDDCVTYRKFEVAEYLSGYSGPPPMVHLRRGETLRRYLQPGLDDGKTFVYWGRNYKTGDVPGPERSHTWVNQPDRMYKSRDGAGNKPGQARYGNAVYVYKPDFATKDYQEGVVGEDERHVVFEFYTPYIIGAAPPNDKPWGIYDDGCRNGLVLRGKADCGVALSTDQGKTWQDCGKLSDGLDLTDRVKGRRQYLLRLHAGAKELATSGLTITTVCQANASVLPRLKDNGSGVRFAASRQAVVSAGPNLDQAQAHVVAGKFGSPDVTLEVKAPRGEAAVAVFAAGHILSGNPPSPEVKYQIDVSADGGRSWKPLVKDWTIPRRGDEPKDFWSQSLCWGSLPLGGDAGSSVRVRFRNDGERNYARGEAHLVYRTKGADGTKVTVSWKDDKGVREASHVFAAEGPDEDAAWTVPTGKDVQTRWVEFAPVAPR
jgi:hypothetical protein